MAKQNINVGTTANDKKGDSLRAAFQKVNENFTELYTSLGLNDNSLNLGAFEFNGSVMTTTDSTAIIIDQATTITSDLTVGGDIVPSVANGGNLGSLAKPFRSLYVSNSTVFLGGVPLSLEPGTNELRVNNIPVSQSITYTDIPDAPTDVSDLTDTTNLLGGGGTAGPVQTYLELTQSSFMVRGVILGTPVSFTRTAEGSQTDAIAPGLRLARGVNGALYNIESETEYDNNNDTSPLGTEWNSDGWGNLVGLATRTYTTFREALNRYVGNNIIGAELVMHDTINDRYYKFSFSNWGGNNGGSFAYTRTLIEDPNYFKKANYATANNVDVIEDDSTLQIGITRGNQYGIYNPFTEAEWDENVSPDGTEWNTDGWDDLTDVETRTYTTFYNAYNQNVGNNILRSKAVMYVPSIDNYYAIQWLSWTQNAEGGGFSYLRYEIDLDILDEGVRFADGTVQKTAYVPPTTVKFTAPVNRRIEEVYGYKQVSVTAQAPVNLTTTASRNSDSPGIIWIDLTTTTIDNIISDPDLAGITDSNNIEFSIDNTNWYVYNGITNFSSDERGYNVNLNGATLTYDQGDTVYFRYVGGGAPVVWWDKEDLPGGGSRFRGAVIDYHAYTDDATIIGTIHIVDDDGEENITHTEVSSGSTDSENDDLWLVTDEGTISYRRLDGEANTLKIQWTAKVFYGSENN